MTSLPVILPHVNAALNAVATVLLVAGWLQIRSGREVLHRRLMLAAFSVSVVFLASYLTYHWSIRSLALSERRLPATAAGWVRPAYYSLLISHIVLAATVPFLACWAIWLGYRDRRTAHRRVARWAFPIWLYVSVTGVLIYLVLYQVYGE